MRPPRPVAPRLAAMVLLAAAAVAAAGSAPAMTVQVDPGELRALIEREWSAVAPPGATLEVRAVPSLSHPGGEVTLEVQLPDDPRRPGPRALTVSCRVDGRVVARGLANVLLRAERTVWIALRPFERGDEIGPGEVREETRVFDREPSRLLTWDSSRSLRAVRAVASGERLMPADVRPIPDVEAGEEILLLAQAGTATVSVPGKARQDGDVGEVILVHNPVSGALVRAVVVNDGQARLVTAGDANRRE
jgi:flagella basal body P-ring formation protein FlgA